MTLNRAQVVGDSLVGYQGAYRETRVAVPIADVQGIETPKDNALKTGLLVLAVAAVPIVYVILVGTGTIDMY